MTSPDPGRRPVSILITCVGGAMAPALLQAIKTSARYEVRLIGGDTALQLPVAERLVDEFHTIPPGSADGYAEAILELARNVEADIIWPASDDEALALARAEARVEASGLRVLVSSRACLELITDKAAVYELLAKAGVPAPEYSIVHNAEDALKAIKSYGHPKRTLILKPARGRGGRGLHVICGEDEPPEWLGRGAREARWQRWDARLETIEAMMTGKTLVMPCMYAPVYDADVLADRGVARSVTVRRRVNPAGIPYLGNRIVVDRKARDYCAAITEVVGLDSLHDIDLMTNDDGELRLIEINPRPSGSLIASVIAGLPVVDAAIGKLLGEEISIPAIEEEIDVFPYMTASTFPVRGEAPTQW